MRRIQFFSLALGFLAGFALCYVLIGPTACSNARPRWTPRRVSIGVPPAVWQSLEDVVPAPEATLRTEQMKPGEASPLAAQMGSQFDAWPNWCECALQCTGHNFSLWQLDILLATK
jgi:hypothetical protein